MSALEAFLTPEEEQEIVQAIQEAELNTSGEIRVHIEASSKSSAIDRAKTLFNTLKMSNTRDRNGVLFYIAVKDKSFAILGDTGINNVVEPNFWESTKNILESHFKQGHFKTGIKEGIAHASHELKRFFPWQSDDTNELPNTITKS